MSELTGKSVLITGASRGIGAAAAAELAARGMRVALVARDHAACEAGAEAIRAAGGEAIALSCDVASWTEVSVVVSAVRDAFGGLDALINNAGVIEPISRLADSDPEAWTRAFSINALGVYHGLRAALPIMEAQGAGVIVNISSGAAYNPLEGWSQYCSAKAAALMLTRAAHAESGPKGVRVVGLSPGTVATDMQRVIGASGVNPVSKMSWDDHIPADWPAKAIAFLCTEAAREFDGSDFQLRDPENRTRLGLG
ncbi:SDR family oxidoreductase [Albimonas pacifica]|uniref:NADP-dependent 3-hydroxy acid dehydrogenase YdfG n=1 Tax=Albimonas pacifica TaxID=1114924 RepID=A0A1I3MN56_9RHOB|nr:SDR family NAD(P)-dependent oxidoreductase [Albimonas pacifica]SFI98155.1 NADP-dependent 3-hydroxy acid dehydrogenase YdfG [Albimonas pacifica]